VWQHIIFISAPYQKCMKWNLRLLRKHASKPHCVAWHGVGRKGNWCAAFSCLFVFSVSRAAQQRRGLVPEAGLSAGSRAGHWAEEQQLQAGPLDLLRPAGRIGVPQAGVRTKPRPAAPWTSQSSRAAPLPPLGISAMLAWNVGVAGVFAKLAYC